MILDAEFRMIEIIHSGVKRINLNASGIRQMFRHNRDKLCVP